MDIIDQSKKLPQMLPKKNELKIWMTLYSNKKKPKEQKQFDVGDYERITHERNRNNLMLMIS